MLIYSAWTKIKWDQGEFHERVLHSGWREKPITPGTWEEICSSFILGCIPGQGFPTSAGWHRRLAELHRVLLSGRVPDNRGATMSANRAQLCSRTDSLPGEKSEHFSLLLSLLMLDMWENDKPTCCVILFVSLPHKICCNRIGQAHFIFNAHLASSLLPWMKRAIITLAVNEEDEGLELKRSRHEAEILSCADIPDILQLSAISWGTSQGKPFELELTWNSIYTRGLKLDQHILQTQSRLSIFETVEIDIWICEDVCVCWNPSLAKE